MTPTRFLIVYTDGPTQHTWLVEETCADFAIARFYKQAFSRRPSVVFKKIFVCTECGEAAPPLGFITCSQSPTEVANG